MDFKYKSIFKFQGKTLNGTSYYNEKDKEKKKVKDKEKNKDNEKETEKDKGGKKKRRRARECETLKKEGEKKIDNKIVPQEEIDPVEDNAANEEVPDVPIEPVLDTEAEFPAAPPVSEVSEVREGTVSEDASVEEAETDRTDMDTRPEEPLTVTEVSVRTSGEELVRPPATLADVKAGLQRAYLEGIAFIRLKVREHEEELTQIKLGFYQTTVDEEEEFEKYLVKCNEHFLRANNELRRRNVKLKVLDSEMEIVSLLNTLREKLEVDKGEIAFISEFWESLKSTMESLTILINKFKIAVTDRLQGNCISYYNNTDIHLDVSARYTEEVTNYLTDIERTQNDAKILIKSYANGLHQDLFSHTKFTEGILVSCDLKAFPILRLFPDLTEKLESMFQTAFMWLDRDETYMYEINDFIRETRSMAKKRVEDLRVQKEKLKKFEKAVKSANILLHNNKEKLQRIETDLNQLEQTFSVYKQQMESKYGEKSQKESMVDFLKITLSQTKKNYNLQLKRQRLLKQVVELEGFLQHLEQDLSGVQNKIAEKAQQKDMLSLKLETNEKSYGALKTNLDQFTDNLEKLEQEVNGLSGQLLQLEIIQTYKSSPENLDGVYDRPQSVKLAPSLKEKIKRKRKIMPPPPVH